MSSHERSLLEAFGDKPCRKRVFLIANEIEHHAKGCEGWKFTERCRTCENYFRMPGRFGMSFFIVGARLTKKPLSEIPAAAQWYDGSRL